MSEVDQLIQITDSILSSKDNATRENAENTLVQLRSSNPNELMLAFLAILAGIIFLTFRSIQDRTQKFCRHSN